MTFSVCGFVFHTWSTTYFHFFHHFFLFILLHIIMKHLPVYPFTWDDMVSVLLSLLLWCCCRTISCQVGDTEQCLCDHYDFLSKESVHQQKRFICLSSFSTNRLVASFACAHSHQMSLTLFLLPEVPMLNQMSLTLFVTTSSKVSPDVFETFV